MEIVCKTCKKPFNAHVGEIAGAVIDFTFGQKHTFICDHCKAENTLIKAEYEALKDAQEAAAKPAAPKPVGTASVKPTAPKPVSAASGVKPAAPKPVAGAPVAKPAAPRPVTAQPFGAEHERPKPVAVAPQPKEGVVLVASLHVRKDHSTRAETVAGLVKGNKVKILGTWTDGKNTWAQIGPDQWAAIEHNGKKMIEVL